MTNTVQKMLGPDMIVDVHEAMHNTLYAYVPVIRKGQIGLGVAAANRKGYMPIPFTRYSVKTYDEAETEANRLNLEYLHMDEIEALRVISSTM